MDKLLITLEDFREFKDVSENIDWDRLNMYIYDSQFIDIRSFLGGKLYLLLQQDYDPLSNTFTDINLTNLWFGVIYDDIQFYGVRPALVQYAYSRLLENININITRSGARTFDSEESEAAVQAQITIKAAAARSMALSFLNDAKIFLGSKPVLYPDWKNNTEIHSTSQQWIKV